MTRGVSIAAVAGALVATCGGTAHAQVIAPSIDALDARLPLVDPEAERDGLEIGARGRTLYDSNLLRLDKGVAVPDGRSRDDLITTVSATARAQVSPSLQRIYVGAEYGRAYFAQNDFLNSEVVALDAGWDWRITPRCAGRVRTGYSRAQVDLADQGVIARNNRRSVATSAGGGCRIGFGLTPSVFYGHRNSDNSSPLRRGTNFETNALQAELSYSRTGKVGVALGYREDRFTFPNRIAFNGGEARTDRKAVGARLDLNSATRQSYSFFIDQSWVTPRGRPERDIVSGGFIAAYRPIPRWRIAATARRDVDVPLFVAASFVIRDRAEVGTAYSISPRTLLSLTAAATRNRFRDRQFAAGADFRSGDRSMSIEAGAAYRLARHIDLGLQAAYVDRNVNGAFGTFSGTRVAASIRVVK